MRDHCSLRTRIGADRVKRAWDYVYSHGCIGKQSPFLAARNMANTSGFIFDPTTGEQIAWIVGTDVFSVETKKKFATLRGTELYFAGWRVFRRACRRSWRGAG